MIDIYKYVKQMAKELPKFPDGRINYRNASKAAVLICFVEYNGEILLLKRSDKVRTYQNFWNTVAGYLDDFKPLEDKIKEELSEEIGIKSDIIREIRTGKIYQFTDQSIKKTWIVQPALAVLKAKPEIKIDWEHTEFVWIKPSDITKFQIVPKIDESLSRVI